MLRILEFMRNRPPWEGILLILRIILSVYKRLIIPAIVNHCEIEILLLRTKNNLLLYLLLLLLKDLLLLALQLDIVYLQKSFTWVFE